MILEVISKKLNITPAELLNYALVAPVKYKRYPIKKRSGGTREIAQPSRDLKFVQRLVVREFFNNEHVFPIHGSATAYICLLYTSPSPRDATLSRMPSSA